MKDEHDMKALIRKLRAEAGLATGEAKAALLGMAIDLETEVKVLMDTDDLRKVLPALENIKDVLERVREYHAPKKAKR